MAGDKVLARVGLNLPRRPTRCAQVAAVPKRMPRQTPVGSGIKRRAVPPQVRSPVRSKGPALGQAISIQTATRSALPQADSGTKRNSPRHVIEKLKSASSRSTRPGSISRSGRVYRFKITLLGLKPPIWRRIEVTDCTFDKLHEHIQTAMGWTSSHLHQFSIAGQNVGDPELLDDGFLDFECIDSRRTKLSQLLPADARRFGFATSTISVTAGNTRCCWNV